MIIQGGRGDLLLIAQPDHAALAERIISRWRADRFPSAARRDIILFATRHHDDGWIDVDSAPMVDGNGGLLDYVHAPEEIRRAIWPRAVDLLASTPYAAALVAQHALHIYDRYRADPAWRGFFAQMERSRDDRLAQARPLTIDNLLADYFFVRMADLMSLAFCDAWTEPQTEGAYEVRWNGARLSITPDPFGGSEVPLAIPARRLPARRFSSADALEAFRQAPLVTVTGTASGPPR